VGRGYEGWYLAYRGSTSDESLEDDVSEAGSSTKRCAASQQPSFSRLGGHRLPACASGEAVRPAFGHLGPPARRRSLRSWPSSSQCDDGGVGASADQAGRSGLSVYTVGNVNARPRPSHTEKRRALVPDASRAKWQVVTIRTSARGLPCECGAGRVLGSEASAHHAPDVAQGNEQWIRSAAEFDDVLKITPDPANELVFDVEVIKPERHVEAQRRPTSCTGPSACGLT